jgi:hypothetical protein
MRKSRAGMRRCNPDIDLSGLKGDIPTPAQETDAPSASYASGLTKFFTGQVAGYERPHVAVSLYDCLYYSLVGIFKPPSGATDVPVGT